MIPAGAPAVFCLELQGSGVLSRHTRLSQQHPAHLAEMSLQMVLEVCGQLGRTVMLCDAQQAPLTWTVQALKGSMPADSLEEPFQVVRSEPGRCQSPCQKWNWTSYASGKGNPWQRGPAQNEQMLIQNLTHPTES